MNTARKTGKEFYNAAMGIRGEVCAAFRRGSEDERMKLGPVIANICPESFRKIRTEDLLEGTCNQGSDCPFKKELWRELERRFAELPAGNRETLPVKIRDVILGEKPAFLCTVLEDSAEKASEAAKKAASVGATCLELRLDKLGGVEEVREAVSKIDFPKLAVCRPPKYDGFFKGTEAERAEWLLAAIESGADAVDVEAMMAPELREKVVAAARKKGVPVVICYENFHETPKKEILLGILKWEEAMGADIAKFAVKANSYEDMLAVLETILEAKKQLKIPFIAIAMGEYGKPSRALGPVLGSAGTYCCVERGKEGAPGQMTVKKTRNLIEMLTR